MTVNLNEIMQEYAKLPFEPYGAYYIRHSAGHVEPEYMTRQSSFIFAVDGKATIYLNDKPFTFGANRIIHCAPDQRFTAQNENEKPAELFELVYVYNGAYTGYMNSSYELEIGNNSYIFTLLHKLSQLSKKVYPAIDGNSMLQTKMLTYSILSEMFSSAQSVQRDNIHIVVEDAKAYMEQHYVEQHTLDKLGGRYGLGGKYFANIFKRYTGISPIEYLIVFRLDVAKRLLRSTVYSVKEISSGVGYDDALYFSRLFKRRFGLSPNKWRERLFRHQ